MLKSNAAGVCGSEEARDLSASAESAASATTATRIHCRDVVRRFGFGRRELTALGPLDLQVRDGEFVCLVGPSGCGKSTLLRMMAGLAMPSEGEVVVRAGGRTPVAMVFQDYGTYPWKSVIDNIRFGLDIAGVPREEAQRRAEHWLERTNLTGFADAWPDQLSGGMRQRVALARALVTEPQILLLDEPFAALDPQLRALMQEELLALSQASESLPTTVMVTHSLEEAAFLAHRVVIMSARPGRVLVDQTMPFERPQRPEIRSSAEFAAVQSELWAVLRSEVVSAQDSEATP